MVVRSLIFGLLCAGVFVGGCGGSSNDSKSTATGAAAGQGGGPAAGGAGNNGKGGSNGVGISGGSGAGTAGASGGVVGSGGQVGGGGGAGNDTGAAGSGGADAGGGGGGGGGGAGADCRVTGCTGDLTCVPNDGVCASAGAASCVDLDTVTCVERPVCGCDGTIYESNCAALAAGTFVGGVQQCETPDGMIACVNAFCDGASEYCDHREHYGPSNYPSPCDYGPAFRSGVCNPLPAGCGSAPTCACVTGQPFPECLGSEGNCSDVGGTITRFCPSGCYG